MNVLAYTFINYNFRKYNLTREAQKQLLAIQL